MFANQMPKVDFSVLSGLSLEVAKQICKKDGTVYSSKPKKADGRAAYVWRMAVFMVSPKPQHHCMPVCADFDLIDWIEANVPGIMKLKDSRHLPYEEQNTAYKYVNDPEFKQAIKKIEDDIVNAVPKEQWYGVKRWKRAFGV